MPRRIGISLEIFKFLFKLHFFFFFFSNKWKLYSVWTKHCKDNYWARSEQFGQEVVSCLFLFAGVTRRSWQLFCTWEQSIDNLNPSTLVAKPTAFKAGFSMTVGFCLTPESRSLKAAELVLKKLYGAFPVISLAINVLASFWECVVSILLVWMYSLETHFHRMP